MTPAHPSHEPTDGQLRDFLLRRLPAQEASSLEEAILLEEGMAERLRGVEVDLIDDYGAGRLAARERGDVQRYLLNSPDNIRTLQLGRLLAREAARAGSGRRRARRALAAALLAAGLAALAFLPDWLHPSAERPGSTPVAGGDAGSSLPVLTLLAEVSRGSQSPSPQFSVLHWKSASRAARLQAEVPAPEGSYLLEIEDASGRRVFKSAALRTQSAGGYRFVDAVVPSQVLGPGVRTVLLRDGKAAESSPAVFTWHIIGDRD